jgi:hypothetical protein
MSQVSTLSRVATGNPSISTYNRRRVLQMTACGVALALSSRVLPRTVEATGAGGATRERVPRLGRERHRLQPRRRALVRSDEPATPPQEEFCPILGMLDVTFTVINALTSDSITVDYSYGDSHNPLRRANLGIEITPGATDRSRLRGLTPLVTVNEGAFIVEVNNLVAAPEVTITVNGKVETNTVSGDAAYRQVLHEGDSVVTKSGGILLEVLRLPDVSGHRGCGLRISQV